MSEDSRKLGQSVGLLEGRKALQGDLEWCVSGLRPVLVVAKPVRNVKAVWSLCPPNSGIFHLAKLLAFAFFNFCSSTQVNITLFN